MADQYAGNYKICDLVKMAVLVDDCKKAAETWADVMGAGPFIISRHVQFDELKLRGEDVTCDMDVAIGMWGEVEIELIQPNDDSPALIYPVDKKQGRLHHLTWITDDLQAETERLESLGYPKLVESVVSPGSGRSAWFDGEKLAGCLLAVYQRSEFLEQNTEMLKAMRDDWDRVTPISYVYDCRTSQFVEEELPRKKEGQYLPTSFNQIGVLVEDCTKAGREWVKVLGVGPATVNRHIQIDDLTYRGQPTEWDQDSCLCQFGPVQIELLQTNDNSPAVHFQPGPNGRIHHVNWLCRNLDEEKARMAKLGYTPIWDCNLAGGEMCMCMFDTENIMGSLCEVYEDSELNQAGYDTVRRMHKEWDGAKDIAYFYDMSTYTMVEEEE